MGTFLTHFLSSLVVLLNLQNVKFISEKKKEKKKKKQMLKLLFDFSSVPRFSPSSLLGSQHQPPSHHLPHIKGDFDSTSSGVSRKESRQSKSNCSESGKFEIKGTCIGNVLCSVYYGGTYVVRRITIRYLNRYTSIKGTLSYNI